MTDPDRSAVTAEELAAWRRLLGLTQWEAADLLAAAHRTYEGWEQGRPAPAYLRGAMRDAARRRAEQRTPPPAGP